MITPSPVSAVISRGSGKRCALDHQRMVPRGREVLRDAGEHAFSRVVDLRQFAVHQGGGANHAAAIDLADGLMAETDAEDRHHGPRAGNQLEADAGPVGIARPGRQHDRLRRLGQDLIHGDLVVAIDARRSAQFAEEMDEVVGEAVVVIDKRQHRVVLRFASYAPSRRAAAGRPQGATAATPSRANPSA